MQGTKDRTFELATATERSGRRGTLVGGALALALLAGGSTAAALAAGTDTEPRRAAASQDAPEDQGAPLPGTQDVAGQDRGAPVPEGGAGAGTGAEPEPDDGDGPAVPPTAPLADGGGSDLVPAGTYGARVLGEGWDERGRYVLVDRGRLTDGPPAEPGVDGTRPVLFDTGAVAERRRIDLADGHSLRFSRSGGEPSYGSGSWADFVTEISGRDTGMLATIHVDGNGRLTLLEEPYRP